MNNLVSSSERILDCTRSLIVAGGYNSFSYADIADVVGIRKASIHHHFPSKVDLVRTLVEQYRQEAEASIARLNREVFNPLDQLKSYTSHWQKCISDSSMPFCVCALLASELPILPPEIAKEVKNYFKVLSDWVTSALKRGSQANIFSLPNSPHVEAEIFIATVHGAMLSARAHGDPKLFRVIVEPLLKKLSTKT